MANIINLNKVRKLRDKTNNKAQADENSVKFGMKRATKIAAEAAKLRAKSLLDGHKRERND